MSSLCDVQSSDSCCYCIFQRIPHFIKTLQQCLQAFGPSKLAQISSVAPVPGKGKGAAGGDHIAIFQGRGNNNSYYYLKNKNGKEKDDRRWVFGTVIKAAFETPAFHI